jgi:hypothetical protein
MSLGCCPGLSYYATVRRAQGAPNHPVSHRKAVYVIGVVMRNEDRADIPDRDMQLIRNHGKETAIGKAMASRIRSKKKTSFS